MRSWPCYERTPLFLQFRDQLDRKDQEVNCADQPLVYRRRQ